MQGKQIGIGLLIAGLMIFPPAMVAIGEPFYITLMTRMLILALAASSLNFVLGYGGMVSFGHAAYFGIGGYVIGIMAQNSIFSAWITWSTALIVSTLLALLIGAFSLRTRDVYFIMITLAFAQMLFFLFTSLRNFGGQDGLTLDRSLIGFGIDLENNTVFYYVVVACLLLSLFFLYRIIHSRFGHVMQSIKANENRMMAIGYPVYRYKLVGFAIGGLFAGLAGVLNANLNTFISPNSLAWQFSGQLMMMVILGGVGRFWGGTVGAIIFILLETIIESYTIYWQFGLGILLLAIVLLAPQGITGIMEQFRKYRTVSKGKAT